MEFVTGSQVGPGDASLMAADCRYAFAATHAAIRARESNPSLFMMART